ncbi:MULTISPECIES: tyrosine-protein phosphatase [unclassified Ruminococcus]|uniref:tyrosine-protein phosphatase n=1 Tax=unclassified Ruminococcus TaxID=2608920 RepID=UPI00210DFB31|nr:MULTISPECIES: CpsB/CapC family capsule biosynthesis tyrosine phosphatase [unclassified Ruminococcus]MCQ4022565.1 capsular biosynthesis protein [Ruminococcus sp. zg-924]MCQ4114805.1 capsular biosynthesis protein [Ruminococcus sp. zg-921]
MVDLHCHILPGIDDGAQTVEESIELLSAHRKQRIRSVVFTPHFNFERTDIKTFCNRREKSLELLSASQEFIDLDIQVKSGAEVYFSVRLNEEELDPLCIEGTNYILIELPVTARPYGLTHTLRALLNRGYIPILAHVERYPYLAEDPTVLYELVMQGCLAQVNTGAILKDNERTAMAMKYLRWELAQLISSDTHSMTKRPPNIKQAMSVVENKLGGQYIRWLDKNSEDVFNGRYIDLPVVKKPKKFFGVWR